MHPRIPFVLALLALIGALPVLAGTHRDVFWSATDPTDKLGFYAPATPGPHPLVIWLHADAGNGEDEFHFSAQAEQLTTRGYALLSVPAPLRTANYTATLLRYAEVLAQARRHSAEIHADPSRTILLGEGTGAHWAALLAVDPRWLNTVLLTPAAIQGVVLLGANSLDLPTRMRTDGRANSDSIQRFGNDAKSWQEASPLAQVHAAWIPPLLLISPADADALSQESIERFRDRLRAVGTASTYVRLTAADSANGGNGSEALLPWLKSLNLERVNRLENMAFDVDFVSGILDPEQRVVSGDEVPFLIHFGGRLLAAANSADHGLGEYAALIEKTGPNAAWHLLDRFPGKISTLASVDLTTVGTASANPNQRQLLLIGLQASNGTGEAQILWRSEASDWHALGGSIPSALAATLLHRDQALGTEVLLLGFSGTGIRAAEVNAGVPTMHAQYELNGASVIAMVNANNDAYALIGGANAGLFRRVDGLAPSWQRVSALPADLAAGNAWAALAAVPNPADSTTETLLVSENGTGRIWRIDPARGFHRSLEFTVATAFAAIWQQAPSQISFGSSQWASLLHPETADQVQAIGLRMQHPDGTDAAQRGAWYLLRQDDASYSYGLVYDYQSPLVAGEALSSVRAITQSPFPADQGQRFYFGGFDARSSSTDSAWIYRAELPHAAIRRGLWWDPEHSGHGIDLQAVGDRWRILLSTYDPDGTPIWYTALGSIEGQRFHADADGLTRYHYVFDQNPPQRRNPERSGTIELRFGLGVDDPVCAASKKDRRKSLALAELSLRIDGRETHWCIEPMIGSARGQSPINVNGLWAAGADDPYWALTLSAQGQGHSAQEIATLFYFDGNGEPRWAQGSAPALNGNAIFTLTSYTATCPGCAAVPTRAQPIGSLVHRFSGACAEVEGSVSIDVSYPDGRGNRFLRPTAALTAVSNAVCY